MYIEKAIDSVLQDGGVSLLMHKVVHVVVHGLQSQVRDPVGYRGERARVNLTPPPPHTHT